MLGAGAPLLGANVSALLTGYTATNLSMPLVAGRSGLYTGNLDTNKVRPCQVCLILTSCRTHEHLVAA